MDVSVTVPTSDPLLWWLGHQLRLPIGLVRQKTDGALHVNYPVVLVAPCTGEQRHSLSILIYVALYILCILGLGGDAQILFCTFQSVSTVINVRRKYPCYIDYICFACAWSNIQLSRWRLIWDGFKSFSWYICICQLSCKVSSTVCNVFGYSIQKYLSILFVILFFYKGKGEEYWFSILPSEINCLRMYLFA